MNADVGKIVQLTVSELPGQDYDLRKISGIRQTLGEIEGHIVSEYDSARALVDEVKARLSSLPPCLRLELLLAVASVEMGSDAAISFSSRDGIDLRPVSVGPLAVGDGPSGSYTPGEGKT